MRLDIMRLDIDHYLKQLKEIVKKFNESDDPSTRYALLFAYMIVC